MWRRSRYNKKSRKKKKKEQKKVTEKEEEATGEEETAEFAERPPRGQLHGSSETLESDHATRNQLPPSDGILGLEDVSLHFLLLLASLYSRASIALPFTSVTGLRRVE